MARPLKHPLRQIAIATNAQAEDAVSVALEGVTGITPGIHTDVQTGAVTVSAFLELADARMPEIRREIRSAMDRLVECGIDPAPAKLSIRKVPARDWAESWKRHFKPVSIGRKLLVKPTWNRKKPAPGQALVLLDPGLSFGTGQHATTRFCLQELVDVRDGNSPQSLLDAGMGSGILALAGVALGFGPVEGFDFDPDCVRTAGENAALNGMTAKVSFEQADVTRLPKRPKRKFDVVCANLMADLLIAEAPRLVTRVASGGRLILAGILTTQFPAVEEALSKLGWTRLHDCVEREWKSGSFVRAEEAAT
jgi:ribosomal protein L11 methyltransferase